MRPALIATIGALYGIIWGLYLNTNITLFFCALFFIFIFVIILKAKSRYVKVIVKTNVLIIFIISTIISYMYVEFKNSQYESVKAEKNIVLIGEIKSSVKKNKYTDQYLINIWNYYDKGDISLILYLKRKNGAKEFEYGDVITLEGDMELAEGRRNYQGFSQSDYYKAKGIYGKILADSSNTRVISKKLFSMGKIVNDIKTNIKRNVSKYLSNENAGILLGMLIGDKDEIEDDTKESFQKSSLIHILCVSRSTCWTCYNVDSKNIR